MKAIKYLILTILILSASEAYAQGSFVLWGCNDKVKGWETFTFVVNQPGVISGIIVEKNLNFEAYIPDSEKMLWFNNSDMKGKSLEISANLNSAVLWLPDGSCVQYKLVCHRFQQCRITQSLITAILPTEVVVLEQKRALYVMAKGG